jgi:hypothetical protein
MKTYGTRLKAALVLIAGVLFAVGLAAPASAATTHPTPGAATSATPQDTAYWRLRNYHTGACLSEHGTTGVVYLASCTTNNSNHWTFSWSPTSAQEMKNEHVATA